MILARSGVRTLRFEYVRREVRYGMVQPKTFDLQTPALPFMVWTTRKMLLDSLHWRRNEAQVPELTVAPSG